jgi:hypothetical protein
LTQFLTQFLRADFFSGQVFAYKVRTERLLYFCTLDSIGEKALASPQAIIEMSNVFCLSSSSSLQDDEKGCPGEQKIVLKNKFCRETRAKL